MNSFIKLLVFLILGPHIAVFAKPKRGVANLISKLRNNPDKNKLKDEYDPRAHLYAKFLNSSFANASLTNASDENNTVLQQQEVVHGKGLLDMFKPRTTINPKEKLFMMYLKSLYDNMTLTTSVGTKSATQPNEDEIMEITCSIKPKIEFEPNHLTAENEEGDGCSTTVKENVNEPKVEVSCAPYDDGDVNSTTCEEETASVGYSEENEVSEKHERRYESDKDDLGIRRTYEEQRGGYDSVVQGKEEDLREDSTQNVWCPPNEIKYLFPDQL